VRIDRSFGLDSLNPFGDTVPKGSLRKSLGRAKLIECSIGFLDMHSSTKNASVRHIAGVTMSKTAHSPVQ
jgi:hypothetical protein